MKQEVVSTVESKLSGEEAVDKFTIISSPPPQKYRLTVPPGYNWFKIIPYEDGIMPYDKVRTILYFKKNGLIEFYVRTNNAPSDLMEEMGYPIPKSPVNLLGSNTIVHGYTLLPEKKHEALFADLIVKNMNRKFHSMPDHSAVAIYIEEIDDNLQEEIENECQKVKGSNFENLDVSYRLRDYVINKLKSNDCRRFRGLSPEEYELERVFPEIYSIKITLLAHDERSLDQLKKEFGPSSIDLKVTWKYFEESWFKALERAANPIKRTRMLGSLPFTASLYILRNWLILPDCSICKCIPRGTVPAEVVSRNYGFRIGLGLDDSEFKLEEGDFLEHCIIMNRNDDLLATITKKLGTLNSVVILAIKDSISRILLQKGVKCTPYDVKDVKINPFDLYEQGYANALAEALDILGHKLTTLPRDLAEALTHLYDVVGYVSPSLLSGLLKGIRSRFILGVHNDTYRTDSTLRVVCQNLFNFSQNILNMCSKGFVDDYTNIPLQKILREAGITVFDNLQFLDAYVLLLRLFTEIIAKPKRFPTYITLIIPSLNDYAPILSKLFKFKKYGVYFIVFTSNVEDHGILDEVGITFKVEGNRAYVRVFDEGTTVIKIDRIKNNRVIENDPEFLSPSPRPDYRTKLFGPALKFIDFEDALRSVVLYEVYKSEIIKIQELNKKLNDIDIEDILQWLQERDFVEIHNDSVKYNDGFEKWFRSAVPSIEGSQIIRAIVDYYFSRNYCVVPVKQMPRMERPDLVAIPILPKLYFNGFKAIAVEVELSLNKGEKSLEQAHRNMVKNPEFPKKHVITLIKFRDKIMKIYDSLEDDKAKERVEILFYDSKRILKVDEVKFVEIMEKAEDSKQIKERERKEERKKETKHKVKITHTRSLLEFVRDKEEKTQVKSKEEVKEPVEKSISNEVTVEDEMHEEDVKEDKDMNGLVISWKDKLYVLEKGRNAEIVVRLINKFLEGKRKNIKIVEKDGMLKVLDEKENVIAKAKISKNL